MKTFFGKMCKVLSLVYLHIQFQHDLLIYKLDRFVGVIKHSRLNETHQGIPERIWVKHLSSAPLLALHIDIRLGLKDSTGTNTLAYYENR